MARKSGSLTPRSSRTQVDEFIKQVATRPALRPEAARGRLIFALDATASRQPAWDRACHIQAEMFNETAELGGLEVQMAYYRGFGEFRAGSWSANSHDLVRQMGAVYCLGGHTQIERVLRHAIDETRKKAVNALVFVGDCMEEDVDGLCQLAGELGMLRVPAFVFQEGQEPVARQAFEQIARLSGGAYCSFDASSAQQLRELLSAVAVYAAGGRRALKDYSRRAGREVMLLTSQLGSG